MSAADQCVRCGRVGHLSGQCKWPVNAAEAPFSDPNGADACPELPDEPVQILRQVGTWERGSSGLLAKAEPFDVVGARS